MAFNVFVVFSKSILQLVGCVFYTHLPCWVVQLFGIACLKFGPNAEGVHGSYLGFYFTLIGRILAVVCVFIFGFGFNVKAQ